MQKTSFSFSWAIVIGTSLLALLVAGLWLWQSGKEAPQAVTNPPAPVTAGIIPSPAPEALPAISPEMATAIQALDEAAEKARTETPLAGGGAELHNGYHSTTAAVIGPDGKVYISHGDDFLANVKSEDEDQ